MKMAHKSEKSFIFALVPKRINILIIGFTIIKISYKNRRSKHNNIHNSTLHKIRLYIS